MQSRDDVERGSARQAVTTRNGFVGVGSAGRTRHERPQGSHRVKASGSRDVELPLSIRELPHRERPRERMRALGAASLSTTELVTMILGTGGSGMSALSCARAVLDMSGGSLGRLAATPMASLQRIRGVGVARAAAVQAALELGRRVAMEARDVGVPMRTPRDVAEVFAPLLQDLPVEEFHVAILDAQHRLERDVLITRGLLNSSPVHPREVFREAIAERAAAVILVHNHPSGDPTPSADVRVMSSANHG